jgi:hypothetical protein
MKIAIIKCSGGLNLGNNFINFGGQYVIKTLHPNSYIETFEFYDSCLPQWASEDYLTPSIIDHIKANFDIIYILSGSAGGYALYENLYKKINEIGIPFIPIGIGCEGSYNEDEKDAINKITDLPNCQKIITRDPKTFEFISNKTKPYSGIDLAFFAKDFLDTKKYDSNFKYAVVNYEPYSYLVFPQCSDLKNQLDPYFDKVYFVENTVIPSRKDIPNYVQIGYAEDLWNFYANASYVVTSRIHSCVCSISNGVDFVYLGHHDSGGKKGRNTLFNAIGITLETDTLYKSVDYQDQINKAKNEYILGLKNFLK